MKCILKHIPRDIDIQAVVNAVASEDAEIRSLVGAALRHLNTNAPEAAKEPSGVLLAEDRQRPDVDNNADIALNRTCGGNNRDMDIDALTRDLRHESIKVRMQAVCSLGSIESSTQTTAAIKALQHALDDPSVQIRMLAFKALGRLGQPAIPVLVAWILTDDSARDDLYATAMDVIATIGERAIASLIEVLDDCTTKARWKILLAFRKLPSKPAEAVALFIKALDGPSARVRFYALHAMETYGSVAAEAVPRLIHALTHEYDRYTGIKKDEYFTEDEMCDWFDDGDLEGVSHIAKVLGAIGPKAQAAIPALFQVIEHEQDVKIYKAAFKAICSIGPSEQVYLRLITHLTGSEQENWELENPPTWSEENHWQVMGHLFGENRWSGLIEAMLSGPPPEQIQRRLADFYLRAIIPDPRPEFSRSLAQAIRQTEAHNCVTLAAEALFDTDDAVVDRAVQLLADIGDLAVAAIPALVSAFNGQNPSLCRMILLALKRIGDSNSILPLLCEALLHGDQCLREEAAETVGRMGIRSDELTSILRKGMTDWEEDIRPSAAFALLKLDPTAREALRLLETHLDPENESNSWALELLLEVGKPALPVVINALLDPELKEFVLDFFMHRGHIGHFSTAEDYVSALLTFLNSEHAGARSTAFHMVPFASDPDSASIIKRLWECLFFERESTQRHAAWTLKEIVRYNKNE